MSNRIHAALCVLFLASPAAFAAAPPLTMADVEALAKSESWSELLESAKRVAPSARTDAWKQLVTKAATEKINEGAEGDPRQTLNFSAGVIESYPHLKKEKAFMSVRADKGLKAFQECFANTYWASECNKLFKQFVADDPQNKDLAIKGGEMVARAFSTKHVAMPYFHSALKDQKPSDQCTDTVRQVVSHSLQLKPPADEIEMGRNLFFGACWKGGKDDLVKKVTGSEQGLQATCKGLLERKALEGARLTKCERIAKGAKN